MTTKAAMNCWEALELLEGIDAGAITADDPLSTEAQQHLATCDSCQTVLPQRLKWNAELTQAMTSVAVPPELESRLSQQLGPMPTATSVVAKPRRSLRRMIAALAALGLLLLFVFWPTRSAEQQITRQVVDANIGCELSQLTPYQSPDWQPELPMTWRTHFALTPNLVYGFPPERSAAVAALVPFEFRHPNLAAPIRGRLVMVPVSRFGDLPASNDFLSAVPEYIAGYGFCAWTEGEWVYLCYVRSSVAEMDTFRRLMGDSLNFL